MATDPVKTQKVASLPTPTSEREVQQYYRQFIRDFAHIARPLHCLTECTAVFTWTTECTKAIDALRRSLCSTPVLAYPDFTRPFVLDTDVSDTVIEAVLSRINSKGHEHVIAYGSHLLTKHERQYCITRELLAVVRTVSFILDRPEVPSTYRSWLADLASKLQGARRTTRQMALVPTRTRFRNSPPSVQITYQRRCPLSTALTTVWKGLSRHSTGSRGIVWGRMFKTCS